MATNKELALTINVVIEYIERFIQEQENALVLLGCCSRHRYMDDYVRRLSPQSKYGGFGPTTPKGGLGEVV